MKFWFFIEKNKRISIFLSIDFDIMFQGIKITTNLKNKIFYYNMMLIINKIY